MIMRSVLLLYCLVVVTDAYLFPSPYPRVKLHASLSREAGSPLFLTPYLKKGEIKEAQSKAKVVLTEECDIESYAGMFTIDPICDSNIFFWYFPAFSKDKEAPVVLWLQGGPGESSLFGLFSELGPLQIVNKNLTIRKHHWAKNYNLIFIDSPVGTGFSFTKHIAGYCTNEQCVGKGLYAAMMQFFSMFPKLQANDFYITGESYAGKFIPSLGMIIHKENSRTKIKNEIINLKGMAIGNGFCDPINQLDYGSYLYQIGLIDFHQKEFFDGIQKSIEKAIRREEWKKADLLLDRLMDGEIGNFSYFKSFTGYTHYYNYLFPNENEQDDVDYVELLKDDKFRKTIHVGGLPLNSGKEVELHLVEDMLKSVAGYIAELLPHYRIMFYNGQLDIIVGFALTDNFIRKLDYHFVKEPHSCRKIWRVSEEIAGYYRVMGNLTQVLVRNAGHMVPRDQPAWAEQLLNRFVEQEFH